MIARMSTPADGHTMLVFCPGCEERACDAIERRGLVEITDDRRLPGKRLAPYCVYCAFCGARRYTPRDAPCRLHGNDCPEDRPEATVQAMDVLAMVDNLFATLTDAGWDHLAEEIRFGGRLGVPWLDAVVENLVDDPYLTAPSF